MHFSVNFTIFGLQSSCFWQNFSNFRHFGWFDDRSKTSRSWCWANLIIRLPPFFFLVWVEKRMFGWGFWFLWFFSKSGNLPHQLQSSCSGQNFSNFRHFSWFDDRSKTSRSWCWANLIIRLHQSKTSRSWCWVNLIIRLPPFFFIVWFEKRMLEWIFRFFE